MITLDFKKLLTLESRLESEIANCDCFANETLFICSLVQDIKTKTQVRLKKMEVFVITTSLNIATTTPIAT